MKLSMQTLQRALFGALLLAGMAVTCSSLAQTAKASPGGAEAPEIDVWTPSTSQTYTVNRGGFFIANSVKSQNQLDVASAHYELYHPDFGWAFTFPAQVNLFNPYEGTLIASNFQIWNG